MKRHHLKEGQKVWHNGRELVFAYMGQDGHAILHPEGEPDMQSCIGVDPETLVAECKCPCHPGNEGHIPGMLHCMPCCDGRCRVCGKWFHGLAEHRKTHSSEDIADYLLAKPENIALMEKHKGGDA